MEIFIFSQKCSGFGWVPKPKAEPRAQPNTRSLKLSTRNPAQTPGFWGFLGVEKKTEIIEPNDDLWLILTKNIFCQYKPEIVVGLDYFCFFFDPQKPPKPRGLSWVSGR